MCSGEVLAYQFVLLQVKVDTKTRKQLDEYLVAKKAALSGLPPPQKTEPEDEVQVRRFIFNRQEMCHIM